MSLRNPPAGFMSLANAAAKIDRKEASNLVHLAGAVTRIIKSGGRARGQDFHMVFCITDHTLGPSHDVEVSFFKPHEIDLPDCAPGDVILIENIKYKGPNWQDNYLSNNRTRSMVLRVDDCIADQPKFPKDAILKDEEKDYMKFLCHWTKENIPKDGRAMPPRIMNASRSRQEVELKQVKADSFYNLCGEVVRLYPNPSTGTMSIYISDYTQNEFFHHYDEDEVDDESAADDYKIPLGKKTLQISLFEPHNRWAESQRSLLGRIVEIDNVHIKFTEYAGGSQLEGKLHTDRMYPDKICIRLCKDQSKVKKIKEYKVIYTTGVTRLKLEQMSKQSEDTVGAGKLAKKSKGQKRKEREELERRELEAKRKEAEQMGTLNSIDAITINKRSKDQSGQVVTYPFMNVCFRANVRVVDFHPPAIEDFAQSIHNKDYNDMSDDSDDLEMDLDTPRPTYEWMFYLIVEDCEDNSNGEKVRMPLLVHGKDADYLLNLDATNLKRDIQTMQKLRLRLWTLWGEVEERKRAKTLNNGPKVHNQGFTCCIKEYGAPDGNGGYIRMHRIFNTTIHTD